MGRELNTEIISHSPGSAWGKKTVAVEFRLAVCHLIHGHSPCPLSLQQTQSNLNELSSQRM